MGSCSEPAQIFQIFKIVGLSQAPHFAGRWRFGVCSACGRDECSSGKARTPRHKGEHPGEPKAGRSGDGRLKPPLLPPCWVGRPESIFYLLYVPSTALTTQRPCAALRVQPHQLVPVLHRCCPPTATCCPLRVESERFSSGTLEAPCDPCSSSPCFRRAYLFLPLCCVVMTLLSLALSSCLP